MNLPNQDELETTVSGVASSSTRWRQHPSSIQHSAPSCVHQQIPRPVNIWGREQIPKAFLSTPERLIIIQSEGREPWVRMFHPLAAPGEDWHWFPLGIPFSPGEHILLCHASCLSLIPTPNTCLCFPEWCLPTCGLHVPVTGPQTIAFWRKTTTPPPKSSTLARYNVKPATPPPSQHRSAPFNSFMTSSGFSLLF